MAYITRGIQNLVNIALNSLIDPDLLVLDLRLSLSSKLSLYNVYNERDQGGSGHFTLNRVIYPISLAPKSVIAGDFNIHHPWWDPLAPKSANAEELVNWIETSKLELLNSLGVGTFYRPTISRESVIDLTLARGITI